MGTFQAPSWQDRPNGRFRLPNDGKHSVKDWWREELFWSMLGPGKIGQNNTTGFSLQHADVLTQNDSIE